MIDIAIAYQRYKFIGLEFLTWLWFILETDPEVLRTIDEDLMSCRIGKRLVLENRKKDQLETVTIKGDAPGLEEAITALKKGALIAEMDLSIKTAQLAWDFSIKGESLSYSSLRLPTIRVDDFAEDIHEGIYERLLTMEKAVDIIHSLYHRFINIRISRNWNEQVVPMVHKWIISQEI